MQPSLNSRTTTLGAPSGRSSPEQAPQPRKYIGSGEDALVPPPSEALFEEVPLNVLMQHEEELECI